MSGSLLDALRMQVASVNSPLMQAARVVQSLFTHAHPTAEQAQGPAAMPMDRGARPTAAQLRDTQLRLPGSVDGARAATESQRTLSGIDFSRDNIVLWVPATNSHAIPDAWSAGVQEAHPDGNVTSGLVNYPATADFNDSVSTGVETLRQVLAGIAAYDEAHGTHHTVTLGGHSQGAWVIGQAMSDPAIHRIVDGAAIYGHPGPDRDAHDTAHDPKIHETNDPDDPFTKSVAGGDQALQGIANFAHGASLASVLPTLGPALLANPFLGAYLIGRTLLKGDYAGERDPHHYEPQYRDGAQFLADRARIASLGAGAHPGIPLDPRENDGVPGYSYN